MQRTPAGLPLGMPGIAEVMEGAIQQAPHWLRQFINNLGTLKRGEEGKVYVGTLPM